MRTKKTNYDMLITRLNGTVIVRLIVAAAKVIGYLFPVGNRSSLFFFFPFFHVGGAEKVHADIVGCFPEEKPWVFFTKRSDNDKFRSLFPAEARLFNVWPLLKYGYPFSVGIMAGLINRHRNPVVFGSNSLFYYLLVPYLKPHVRCIDLLHAFGGCSDNFSLPVADKLDRRVVITAKTLEDLKGQYLANSVDPGLLERIAVIENSIEVPERYPEKKAGNALKVIFVGRGSPEKRVHLVGRAASRCREKGIPADFTMVGEVGEAVETDDRANCLFRGEVSDFQEMAGIYAGADVLVLTSSREGFPLVIMEAMAGGVVPVCTNVGGIAAHIRNGTNGILVENVGEDEIVERLVAAIESLAGDRALLGRLSLAAYEYARSTFGFGEFRVKYRKLLLDQKNVVQECPCRK